ncbi:hypothetical protein IV53_GL000661 [Ligilactobacillus ceti DSM 22408]|uniref:Uncharacterized protein n=2 Tax=Ligilactobacillus TaxID=2767887 RepID=A0A0R2KQM7_9LACO|nr:hypothetical protein IV53_GL000661 [Ligilactobacillus ceti DSM 22408]
MADALDKALDLEEEIKTDEIKLNAMKVEALDIIGEMPSTVHQQILIGRYFEHLSWDKLIAKVLYERRYVYKMHGRALCSFEKIVHDRKKTLKDT